jgi:4-alpha-glucanotransferase
MLPEPKPEPELAQLAKLWNIMTSYVDVEGRRIPASRESLLAILEALGAPLSLDAASPREVTSALRARHRELWRRAVEPVVVAWGGRLTTLRVRLPAGAASGNLSGRLELEDGGVATFRVGLDGATVRERAEVDGREYVSLDLAVRQSMPLGYHRLSVSAGRRTGKALVIAAPRKAAEGADAPRLWGAFVPLYAVHSEHSLGIGDFRDLGELQDWIGEQGGHIVATLPLFATFLDNPFQPSPYSPVTRRFWNDTFIDVGSLPELETSTAAREAFAEVVPLLKEAGREPLVDYRRVAAAKRSILSAAAADLFSSGGRRREELERFAAADPALEDYAAFRAFGEAVGAPWHEWPDEARAGRLAPSEVPEDGRNYHRYAQFVASAQLAAAGGPGAAGLMLDLPLGVHPAGYDVWRERDAFLHSSTAGAPPDPMNAKGQDWGNPPLDPVGVRAQGYAYVIDTIRRLMARSRVLRIDHVMGQHRLFVLPPGRDARGGVYIKYRSEENYAILCLESQRAGTMVVGEDLGTVPPDCRRAMPAHRVYGCHVAQWGIRDDGLERPAPDRVASIETHDMPPFAAWWHGLDITERLELGLLSKEQAAEDTAERERDRKLLVKALVREKLLARPKPGVDPEVDVLGAWLAFLARGDARTVLVFMEDLWGETHSQNIPGTVNEHPNWQRRMQYALEAIRSMPEVVGRLQLVHDLRTRAETAQEGTTWRSR